MRSVPFVILFLFLMVFMTTANTKNIVINTPYQQIEFNEKTALPIHWNICYPDCSDRAKIVLNVANEANQFFSLEQLQSIENIIYQPVFIENEDAMELMFELRDDIDIEGMTTPISKINYVISKTSFQADMIVYSSNPIKIRIDGRDALQPENITGLGGLYNGTQLITVTPQDIGAIEQKSWVKDSKEIWHGIRTRFWSFLISPRSNIQSYTMRDIDNHSFVLEALSDSNQYHFSFYFGPVEKSALVSVSTQLKQLLYTALWDWLRWICFGLQMILGWVYSWLGHMGLSIILLSVIVKILLYPLSRLAEKWQREVHEIQAWLQPRLKEIKAQYTGEEAHTRTLALYKEKQVNPMFTFKSLAGLLIQIPIFIAVFDMLGESILLKQQSLLWIKDLSIPDHWIHLPFLIPFFGESFNLLPLLMMLVTALGAFFFQDQHLKGNLLKQQKRKLYLMAFAFFILFYTFPAGMVFYWTTSNSLQLIKVIFLRYQT